MKINYFLLLGWVSLWWSCGNETIKPIDYIQLTGKTMGTTYSIKYQDSLNRDFKSSIDSLLVAVNNEVSTYEPESFISRFNKSEAEIRYLNLLDAKEKLPLHFKANFEKAKEVFAKSSGYFDPTVMPIVNYWGFGYTEKKAVTAADKMKVDSLIKFVGLDNISQRSSKEGWVFLEKNKPGVQLDFSALAKGYGVDAIAQLLRRHHIQNYFVEIGGEVIVKGKNPQNQWWTVGISTPTPEAGVTDIQAKVELQNQAMATSGNYRNYYEVDGVKYAHTINPKTGFPEKNTLLSTTIFAADCMTADAYATACMTMGLEKAAVLVNELSGIDAYFLYSDSTGTILSKSTSSTLNIIQ